MAVAVEVRLYREAIANTVAAAPGLELVGEASSTRELSELVETCRPHVVLVDAALPDVLAALRQMTASHSSIRILALGLPPREEDIVTVAELGVAGFIGADSSLAELAPAIRMVMNGEAPCTGRIAATLLRRVAAAADPRPLANGLEELTLREREILELVDAGLSNKEIAGRLVIGIATVKSHIHTILRKLGVDRRAAAAARLRGSA